MDIYHFGDTTERCRVTFMLMDPENKEVTLQKFKDYLNLIMAAIRKVHSCKNDENLLSEKEIKLLFNKISNKKHSFDFNDFEKVYIEKPELLSWIDYFKSNDEEALLVINDNLRLLLSMMRMFFIRFSKIMEETVSSTINQSKDTFELKAAINEINAFCKAIQKKRNNFNNLDGVFNLRSVLENLTKSFNDTKLVYNGTSPFEFRKDSGIRSSSKFIYYKNVLSIEAQQDLSYEKVRINKNHTHTHFIEDVPEFNAGKYKPYILFRFIHR